MIKTQNGFTLIELVITVAIIGIITAVAWPEYKRHKIKTRRVDGISALMAAAHELQQCHTDVGGYTYNNDADTCSFSANSAKGYFTITADIAITESSFTLTATPTSSDPECATLTLNHLGLKDFTSTSNPAGTLNRCWSQ